jgi:hypothetical protein
VKPQASPSISERFSRFIGGTGLAIILFGAIILFVIPGTFGIGRSLYSSMPFKVLLALLVVNLLACTVQRWKRLKWPVLLLHGGVLVVLFGALLTSFGYVATVNIFERGKTEQAYRWDLEQEVPLGFDLAVEKIHREYLPVPVKVGVLRGGDEAGLHILNTGESFNVGDYKVLVDSIDLSAKTLHLTIFRGGLLVGTTSTSGETALPGGFPYEFRLVAFKSPVLRRAWVDLKLLRDAAVLAQGSTEINSPFQWGGLYFYNTLIDKTPLGEPFAGIQIVRDPGRPVVFAGFVLAGVGALALFMGKVRAAG